MVLVPALNFLIIVTKHAVLQEKVDMPCFLLLHIELTLLDGRAMPIEIYLLGDFNLVKVGFFMPGGFLHCRCSSGHYRLLLPPHHPLWSIFRDVFGVCKNTGVLGPKHCLKLSLCIFNW